MLFKLAWRNVWRNSRRSALTIIAVAFGLALCIYTYAFAVGYHNQMIRDSIQVYAGHIQIHAAGWDENRTMEFLMDNSDAAGAAVAGDDRVMGIAARAEVPGLVSRKLVSADGEDSSGEENTSFVIIAGIDPAAERKITVLPDKIKKGQFLSDDDPNGVIIGKDLAKMLDVGVGDRVLLWTQNYYETLEARYFFVRGIFKSGAADTDSSYVFANLETVQQFLQLETMITTVTIRLNDPRHLESVAEKVKSKLDPKKYETLTWEETMPELRQYIVLDDIGAYVFLGILVIVVSFGILNTQLMAVFERTRELGAMLALGTRPKQIALLVFSECTLMTGVGVLIGNVLGFTMSYINTRVPWDFSSNAEMFEVFGIDPRMYAEITWENFPICSGIILGLAMLMSLWPAIRAARFKPVDALRHV